MISSNLMITSLHEITGPLWRESTGRIAHNCSGIKNLTLLFSYKSDDLAHMGSFNEESRQDVYSEPTKQQIDWWN